MIPDCFLFSGAVELVDVSSNLPGLKYVNGLTTWKVVQAHCRIVWMFCPDGHSRFPTDLISDSSGIKQAGVGMVHLIR